MIARFYAWILPIKPIKFDLWGTMGWKWYGGYAIVNKDRLFRLEGEDAAP